MASKLHYNVVSPELLRILKILMAAEEFKDFRFVGGTALSLYRGHRESLDIDLFTDALYGSIDFEKADEDFDPICLKGKYWELIKLDLIDLVSGLEIV